MTQVDQYPLLGAIAVLVHNDLVLLARRIKEPDAGLWGFPGGHVEWGETALVAAARELHEETGVVAAPVDYLTNVDVLQHGPDGQARVHFLLAAVLCDFVSGTPVPSDDVSDAAWLPCADVRAGRVPMSDRVAELMDLALAAQARRSSRLSTSADTA